jgi:hypothetical protein
MARTPLAAGLVSLAYDGSVASANQTPDATNGNVLPFSVSTTPATFGPFRVILMVTNSDTASHTMILRSSGYTGAANGAVNSGLPSPSNTVFAQSTMGDASYAVAASTTRFIGPLTTDRFVQPNGTTGGDLWIDWDASTSMKVTAILLPTNTL